jgi:hypothetical protein
MWCGAQPVCRGGSVQAKAAQSTQRTASSYLHALQALLHSKGSPVRQLTSVGLRW